MTRTPHTRARHSLAIACGAVAGPLVAILFVLLVIWIAGLVS
jgi:hypothetical protein